MIVAAMGLAVAQIGPGDIQTLAPIATSTQRSTPIPSQIPTPSSTPTPIKPEKKLGAFGITFCVLFFSTVFAIIGYFTRQYLRGRNIERSESDATPLTPYQSLDSTV